jgi:hypothetical protein
LVIASSNPNHGAVARQEERMSRRRGEVTKQAIDRDWPHQVEVIATVCQGRQMDVVLEFCRPLSVAPLCGRRVRHSEEEYLRYAFSDPAHADAFQARFGGRRLTAAKVNGR